MTRSVWYGFKYHNIYFMCEQGGHSLNLLPMIRNDYAINCVKELLYYFTLNEIKEILNNIVEKYEGIHYKLSTYTHKSVECCMYVMNEVCYISSNEPSLHNNKIEDNIENKKHYEDILNWFDNESLNNYDNYLYHDIENCPKANINLLKFQDIFCHCCVTSLREDKTVDFLVNKDLYGSSSYNFSPSSACAIIDLDDMQLKCYKNYALHTYFPEREYFSGVELDNKEYFSGVELDNKEYSLQSISYEYIKSIPNYQHFQTHVVEELIKKSMHPSRFLQFCEL